MLQEEYSVDPSGGPYFKTGEKIKRGNVIGKDAKGKDVICKCEGKINRIVFDGKTHCFCVSVKQESN